MQKKISLSLVIFIMLFLQVSLWSQTAEGNNTTDAARTALPAPASATNVSAYPDIYKPMIGPTLGLGASWQHSTSLIGGEISPRFALQFGARGLFRFSETTGIRADLGINFLGTKDENSTTLRKYSLTYLYLDIAPFITFKNFFFSSGIYFGFILKANYNENNSEDSSRSRYTTPDMGLTLGIGHLFRLNHFMHLFVNLNIKYQLAHFRKEDAGLKSGKIFSIYVDVSLLFEL